MMDGGKIERCTEIYVEEHGIHEICFMQIGLVQNSFSEEGFAKIGVTKGGTTQICLRETG